MKCQDDLEAFLSKVLDANSTSQGDAAAKPCREAVEAVGNFDFDKLDCGKLWWGCGELII